MLDVTICAITLIIYTFCVKNTWYLSFKNANKRYQDNLFFCNFGLPYRVTMRNLSTLVLFFQAYFMELSIFAMEKLVQQKSFKFCVSNKISCVELPKILQKTDSECTCPKQRHMNYIKHLQ